MNRVHFSSARGNWRTPKAFYQALDAEFGFDHDPCPVKQTPFIDGLESEWGAVNFVNPPYKKLAAWLEKGFAEWKKGKTVVFLIPSRTDTKPWHKFVMRATEIRFIKGRLKFDEHETGAPFPSAIVVFKSKKKGTAK